MKLRDYLKKNRFSLRTFAKETGVNYLTLFKITKGHTPRIETASKIVETTDGVIAYEDLGFSKSNETWTKLDGKV